MKNNCLDCGKECFGIRCSSCNRKFSGKSFDFGEHHFDTQTDLDNVIKNIIQNYPKNIEFEEEFLSCFLNKYHPEIVKRNYKITKFKILNWDGQVGQWEFCRDRFRGGVYVLGYFEPINSWHGVTLYPHKRTIKNIREKFILALRQKWSERAKKSTVKTFCENCGGIYPELHHDTESFKNISEECLKLFTEKELAEGIGEDWWLHENEADALPNNHPAVIKLHELHEKIKYKWLCHECHKNEHNKLRGELHGNTK